MESHQKEIMIQDMLMQNQLITLVKEINAGQNTVGDLTDNILYNSFCIYQNTKYLSLIYKLIFYSYKQHPEVAYTILRGFIQFGQSNCGKKYKPLIDYFAIEAFNGLLKMGGWAIIKPFVIQLRSTIYNFSHEPVFKHIIDRIVIQLKTDVNEKPYNSDLCCNLPREKSFIWGWFSYMIVHAYYGSAYSGYGYGTAYYCDIKNEKKMRKYMMFYRKLITQLRKNALEMMRINALAFVAGEALATDYPAAAALAQAYAPAKIEENWNGILNTLETAEYQWVTDIIERCETSEITINTASAAAAAITVACEPVAITVAINTASEAACETAINTASEAACKTASEAVTAAINAEEAIDSEAVKVEAPSDAPPTPIKNNGWLYSLFGWA